MATSRVKLNSREIQSYLDGRHGVSARLQEAAERAADAARSSAPVASGTYRDRITVETDRTDRMVKRVVADVSYAAAVEGQTGNLARALDAAK